MPVVAQNEVRVEAFESLRRLAVVHAYDLRLKMVTELFLREMSPTQFFNEFGGGSPTRVERHFKRLEEYGWLRLVREESGGKRRGGCEHFYRASELAILEADAWALLPYSVRAAYAWITFKQLAERVREAAEEQTLDARPDRHVGSVTLVLDEQGRERVLAAAGELFEAMFEEQAESRVRVFERGEKPFLVTAATIAFDPSTDTGAPRLGAGLVEGRESLAPTHTRLSKVIGDDVCLHILDQLNQREMSVTEFYCDFYCDVGRAEKSAIRHRFNTLEQAGWLTKVGKRPGAGRRGPREHVYRAAGPALSGNEIWSGAPERVKAAESWRAFEAIAGQVTEAIRAGTFDARLDRHLTWALLALDELGWANVVAAIAEFRTLIADEQERARQRLAESDERPLKLTVATMVFESPKSSAKAP